MTGPNEVLNLFDSQSVNLHSGVRSLLEKGRVLQRLDKLKVSRILLANSLFAAADYLPKPLASGTVEKDPEIKRDIISNTLVDMANGSVEPILNDEVPSFQSKEVYVPTCVLAEAYFIDTLKALQRIGHDGYVKEDGSHIFTMNSEPVLLRKSAGESSALTLREILINGIPFPAGSIVAVKRKDRYGVEIEGKPHERKVEALPVEDISAIKFRRLSAFVREKGERSDGVTYSRRYRGTVKNTNMAEIYATVESALARIS